MEPTVTAQRRERKRNLTALHRRSGRAPTSTDWLEMVMDTHRDIRKEKRQTWVPLHPTQRKRGPSENRS